MNLVPCLDIHGILRHMSPVSNRKLILEQGLVPCVGKNYADYYIREFNIKPDNLVPVIFFSKSLFYPKRGYDIWEVDVNMLDMTCLYRDPAFEGFRRISCLYTKSIPSSLLTLKMSKYAVI